MLSWRSHPGAQRVPAPHPCCGCGALCVPTAARPPPIHAQLGLGCPQRCRPQPCTARVLPQSWLAGRKCSLVVLGWFLQQRVAMGRPSGGPVWFRCAPEIQTCKGRAVIQAPWLWKRSWAFRGSSLFRAISCALCPGHPARGTLGCWGASGCSFPRRRSRKVPLHLRCPSGSGS